MPGMLFGFPFNEELFDYNWRTAPDPVTLALYESGALQLNADIAAQISQGSDVYTVPFYDVIGGDEQNYDGKTDIVPTTTTGSSQSGIVYGRMKAWTARDFTADFNKNDPMGAIVAQVARYWAKKRQARMVGILDAVFGVTLPSGDSDTDGFYAEWAKHTMNIASSSTTVAASNKLGETTIGDAAVKACGDLAAGSFSLAIMHSTVANNLSGLNLLNYRKYTDPQGIERELGIADVNGKTAIVTDQVPTTAATTSKAATYTTYVLGAGALQYAPASVDHPVEGARDPYKNGGQDTLITRVRETILPNGFTYTKQASDDASPSDTMLFSSSRYTPIHHPKSIAMAKIVSNG